MEINNLEKALLLATDGIKAIPPRSQLLEVGLVDSEARAFNKYLKNKGYVKLSDIKRKFLEAAEIEFEAMKLSISIKLEDAISISI